MDGDAAFDCVAGQAPAGPGREQRVAWVSAPLVHPCPEDGLGGFGERDRPLLASLAGARDVRPGTEGDVGAVEAGDLGDPQAGLEGEDDERPVAAAFPALLVRGVRSGRRLPVR